jgi:hypothetical protein
VVVAEVPAANAKAAVIVAAEAAETVSVKTA